MLPLNSVSVRKLVTSVLLAMGPVCFVVGERPCCGDEAAAQLAQHLLNQAGILRGVGAVIGTDGELPLELTRFGELLLHVREPDADTVETLRTKADQSGYGIDRLVID